MTATSLFYVNEKHGKTQPRVMDFTFNITGAKTSAIYPVGADCFYFYDAITQAQINSYLGSTNEFLDTYFDSTSMGADTFGGIVNMENQAGALVRLEANCSSGTGGSTLVSRFAFGPTGMTATTLETSCAISSLGNLAFKVNFGNTPDFDGLTTGLINVKLYWIAN